MANIALNPDARTSGFGLCWPALGRRSALRYVACQAHMNCFTSFFLSALLVFSTQASAENRENPCESGSGVGSYICAENELKSASKKLSQTYKKLTVEVSNDKGLLDLLGGSQKSWLLHVDQTCKFVMSAFPGHVSWMSARELWCKERQYNQRNLELTEIYECLTEGGAKCTY